MLPPSTPRAEQLLELANDPEFEAKLRAAYQGRHDVLDALWWAAHPLTSTPRGVADPASKLRDLQRAAFSRSASEAPGEVQEAERRLHEAEQLLADDALKLADAVAAVESGAVPREHPRPHDDTHPTDEPKRPLRKYLISTASVAAVLAAIIVLPALSDINSDADTEPTPTPTSTTTERARSEIVSLVSEENVGDPLAILERPYTPGDSPSSVLRWQREAYRALPELVHHAELYIARGAQPDSVCLVVVREELSMSTCTPETDFDVLRLGAGRYEVNSQVMILTESYLLLPDGNLRYEATARVTGENAASILS